MFQMTVGDVFSIRGRGTVLTGTVEQGAVRVGDMVRIGQRSPVRVDGIEAFRKLLDEAQPGMNIGLLFKKLGRGEVQSGDLVTGS